MPEGHTIHRHARNHADWLGGQRVAVSSPQGRFAEDATSLDGRRFVGTEAWGKHLFHVYEDDILVHIHLGLFGKFRRSAEAPPPVGQVRMRLVGEDGTTLDLNGPTKCERITREQAEAKVAKLGPDPLRPDGSAERFWENLQRRRRRIADVLLDQQVIAGIGNVYRAELLLQHRIPPETPACELSAAQAAALWDTAVAWLSIGVRYNRILCATPEEVGRPFSRMRKRERVRIYGRNTCALCEGPSQRDTSGARALYWCPRCQAEG